MKLLISGYGKENQTLSLVEVFDDMTYKIMNGIDLISPSFFVVNGNQVFTYEKKTNMVLHHLKIENHKLSLLDSIPFEGDDLTHLAFSNKHQMLIGCSYRNGSFFSVQLEDNLFKSNIQHEYQIEDQKLSRAHAVIINTSETEVAIINISFDQIFFYSITDHQLKLTKKISVPVGSGPRHGMYLNDDIFYIITEYSNEMIVIDLKMNQIIQTISTLPNFTGKSSGATLLISNDQKYLYASNRGEDSIAIFEIQKSYKLKYIKSIDCGGKHPRHMTLSKDNRFIISCNMHTNNVSVIDIKQEKVILDISFESPSCVLEI